MNNIKYKYRILKFLQYNLWYYINLISSRNIKKSYK